MKKSLTIILLLLQFSVFSQNYSLSGYIKDAQSGEAIIAATIGLEQTGIGTISNEYGFFTLKVPSGEYNIQIKHMGYIDTFLKLKLTKDTSININLKIQINSLSEVEVKAQTINQKIENPQMSFTQLDTKEITRLSPQLMGETDILKSLSTLPGIQGGMEGSTQISVRGGAPGQNLILLDGIPIYYTSHLLGFMSVFNTDAIKQVGIYKGGFPARYGGRLSSVIDIRMKEGNTQKKETKFDIGLLSTKICTEGPIKKKASYIISARLAPVSYLFWTAQKMIKNGTITNYNFYDLSAKFNYQLNSKNKIYLSLYSGSDVFKSTYKTKESTIGLNSSDFSLGWGNNIALLRWNHVYKNKIFTNTAFAYSRYQLSSKQKFTGLDKLAERKIEYHVNQEYRSAIEQYEGYWNLFSSPINNYIIRAGVSANYQKFLPNAYQTQSVDSIAFDTSQNSTPISSSNIVAYLENEYKINKHINFNVGIHFNEYFVEDTFFSSLGPRLSLNFMFTPDISLKLSYAKMQQNIHLLGNSSLGLPTDVWVPATKKVIPEKSQQVALGLTTILKSNILITNEFYYKQLSNMADFKAGTNFLRDGPETDLQNEVISDWRNRTLSGKGEAYGWEFSLSQKTAKMQVNAAYNLSWSWRQFIGLNSDRKFPYRYGRRHKINLNMSYSIKKNIQFNLNWVYMSGFYISVPLNKYPALYPDSKNLPYYVVFGDSNSLNPQTHLDGISSKNNFETPAYHRLDIGFSFTKRKKKGIRVWNIGVYNLYNRLNAFNVFVTGNYTKTIEKLTIFPTLPSISYRYTF